METKRLREIHSDLSISHLSLRNSNSSLPVSPAVILAACGLSKVLSPSNSFTGDWCYAHMRPLTVVSVRSGSLTLLLCSQPLSPRQQRCSVRINNGIRLGDLKKLLNIANLLKVPVKGLITPSIPAFPFLLNLFFFSVQKEYG